MTNHRFKVEVFYADPKFDKANETLERFNRPIIVEHVKSTYIDMKATGKDIPSLPVISYALEKELERIAKVFNPRILFEVNS